jgi:hypothetical protein
MKAVCIIQALTAKGLSPAAMPNRARESIARAVGSQADYPQLEGRIRMSANKIMADLGFWR